MKKYFDNTLFYLQKSGGGSVYWGELVKRFNLEPDVYFTNPNLESSNIVLNDLDLKPAYQEKNIPLGLLRYLPVTIKIEEGSIFHSSYYRFSNQRNVKNIVTVHDFIYEHFSSGIPKFVHHKQKYIAVKKSKGIICISESTKEDLLRFFPNTVKGKDISVIYNGVSEDFNVIADKLSIDIKYRDLERFKCLLYVGHRTKYKNFDFAVQVAKDLPENYKLIIVGNTLTDGELKYMYRHIPNKYIFLGNVTNEELNELYNIAECLIYPSSYEGFGIPIIEAFRAGCPVVAQDIPVVNEIAHGAALLVNSLVSGRFTESILSLDKESVKKDLINKGFRNSEKYSWDKCFSEVKEFYNSI